MSDENYVPDHRLEDDSVVGQQNPMFSNGTYDRLKFLAQVVLPSLGTLYFALSTIWGLPAGEEVVGTIVALDAFLGVLLGVSSRSYATETEGKVIGFADVTDDDDGRSVALYFPGDPNDIVNHDKVTFKVRKK